MRVLFLFLDGVGLGPNDPATNPLARASMPHLHSLLEGRKMVDGTAPFHGECTSLLALDASLGVAGLPQSATGQAVLLTGHNIPAETGSHYGPKPNQDVTRFLKTDTLFHQVLAKGKKADLLNAYPERYFDGINSGKRLYSAIPLAVTNAGISLHNTDDLKAGIAISADFTGQGWHERLGITDIPVLLHHEAGKRLATLAQRLDFAMFEYWPSDYAGHGQEMGTAVELLEQFDTVLGGLIETWSPDEGLVLLTSDHGNLEDLGTRKHTPNPVLCLLVGNRAARMAFSKNLHDLTGIAPAVLKSILP